jgi:hypothetical protein
MRVLVKGGGATKLKLRLWRLEFHFVAFRSRAGKWLRLYTFSNESGSALSVGLGRFVTVLFWER